MLIIKSTFDSPFVTFSYQNIQKINNAGFVGMIIGASVGYFLILFVVVIFLARWMTRRRLRDMQ